MHLAYSNWRERRAQSARATTIHHPPFIYRLPLTTATGTRKDRIPGKRGGTRTGRSETRRDESEKKGTNGRASGHSTVDGQTDGREEGTRRTASVVVYERWARRASAGMGWGGRRVCHTRGGPWIRAGARVCAYVLRMCAPRRGAAKLVYTCDM